MTDLTDDNAPDDRLAKDSAPSEDGELSPQELQDILADLKTEHRRVDTEISALIDMGAVDMLKIGRMKKIKLSIKDQISYLENQITPDIIA